MLIVVIAIAVHLHAGNFLSYTNLTIVLVNVSSMLIAGIAAARLLITGNVDLSIGGQYSLLCIAVGLVARESHGVVQPVIAALLLGALLGVVNGYLVRILSISPIIVTLGLSFVYFGLAYALSGSQSVYGFSDNFLRLGRDEFLSTPGPVWIALIYAVVGGFLLTRTVGGIRSYAIGSNPAACRNVGINVDAALVRNFAYMGLSMGLVALLSTARLGSGTPDIGVNFELEVLTAVIVGGIAFNGGAGRPSGVFLGVVLLGIVDAAMIFLGFEDFYQRIAKGTILLLALGADQYGQHRRQKHEKVVESAADVSDPDAPGRSKPPPPDLGTDLRGEGGVALTARSLTKDYGAVRAVKDVSLGLNYGEVTCLVGDNGAGKSTLIKMLAGAVEPTVGHVEMRGASERRGTYDARRRGIETVWQDLAVCPHLGVAYNLCLGAEPIRFRLGPVRVFDPGQASAIARDRLTAIGVKVDDLFRPLSELSGGQRQSVAIGRAIRPGVRVVILDEPTAALGVSQTRNVIRLVRRLADAGVAVLLVSHDVEVVRSIADRYLVLSRGRLVSDSAASELDVATLLHMMAGLPNGEAETDGERSKGSSRPVEVQS